MSTIDEIQKKLDNNTLDPNSLTEEQRIIIDELINRGRLKGPTMSELSEKRDVARTEVAREKQFTAEPLASALAAEDSFFKGRPTAVLAGDLTGSLVPFYSMRKQIYGAAKSGNLWKRGPGRIGNIMNSVANRLPGRLKVLGGALRLFGRAADVPAKVLQSPLGKAEVYSVLGGTAGAGVGSVTYDMVDEQAGVFLSSQITDAFADLKPEEIDKDITLNALNEMNSAFKWNAGAAALSPFLRGTFGRLGNYFFGTRGPKQKELAEFTKEKGLPIPLIQAMDGGPLSSLGKKYFKTIGVFPFVGDVAEKAFQQAEQTAGRQFLNNITSYAPLMKTSALSHSVYNQVKKVFDKNIALIGAKYDAFDATAKTAGDPKVIKLEQTVKKARELQQSLIGSFPDTSRSMASKTIDEVLKGSGDSLNLFYDAMSAIGDNLIRPTEYKGVIQMLNQALRETNLETAQRSIYAIREALENDFAAFGSNLNKGTFLSDAGIKATYDGFAATSKELAEKDLSTKIAAGETLNTKLKEANETFHNILQLYEGTAKPLTQSLRRFDKNLFTNKATFGFVGGGSKPRELIFDAMEKDVFQFGTPEAIDNFKILIGAMGADATKNGKVLFEATKARYMFNTFLDSFTTDPQAKSIFREVIDSAPFVKSGNEYAQDVVSRLGVNSIYKRRGFSIEDVKKGNGIFDVKDLRFSPDDFAQFDIGKFMNKLGIGKATGDVGREKMAALLGNEGTNEFYKFTNYMKSISDVPISDASTFLQRRFTLTGARGIVGGLLIGGGMFTGNPLAPVIFTILARRFGQILTDPVGLRYMNDALLPDETIRALKGKKVSFDTRLPIPPRLRTANPLRKRELFARFYNYFKNKDIDLPDVDLENVTMEELQRKMEDMSYQIPQPKFEDQNLPAPIVETMFAGDFVNPSGDVNEDNDMVAYLRQAAQSVDEQEADQIERDREADDPSITDDLQLQDAFGTQIAQAPQVPQVPQGQATAQDVQALFPFDTTAAAIAQRRQNRG
jgi:hypothetical protein